MVQVWPYGGANSGAGFFRGKRSRNRLVDAALLGSTGSTDREPRHSGFNWRCAKNDPEYSETSCSEILSVFSAALSISASLGVPRPSARVSLFAGMGCVPASRDYPVR